VTVRNIISALDAVLVAMCTCSV